MRIYIAGPYSDDNPLVREQNVVRAMTVGRELLRQGHAPFIPHLTHWFDQWATERNDPVAYEDYLRWDAALLEVCDGVLWLGSSPGADRELELAVRLGMPVLSRLSREMQ